MLKVRKRRFHATPSIVGKAVCELERVESCPDCGCAITFPNLNVRFVYSQCPHCLFQLKEAIPLSIPPPHHVIRDEVQYGLCMARVFNAGKEAHCPRQRRGDSVFCRHHDKVSKRPGGLPYGRMDVPYSEPHELRTNLKPTIADILSKAGNSAELGEKEITYEERVQKTRDEGKLLDPGVDDSVLLARTAAILKRERIRGRTHEITTERIANVLEPTFGVDLRRRGSEKLLWLKNSIGALMALPDKEFVVLAAALGDERNPEHACDVSKEITTELGKQGGNRLVINTRMDLRRLFDLSLQKLANLKTEKNPILRVRYFMRNNIGEVTRMVDRTTYRLTSKLKLCVPFANDSVASSLTIIRATYGHRNDPIQRFTISPQLQGMIDSEGESKFLGIESGRDMSAIFGEPCQGVEKQLTIAYRIEAKLGDVSFAEAHDCLILPVQIYAPIVAPALVIDTATLSPKQAFGRSLAVEPSKFATPPTACMDDVTDKIQRLVDVQGGDMFGLEKGDNVFTLLGLPFPRNDDNLEEMVLRVEYRNNGKRNEFQTCTNKHGELCESIFIGGSPAAKVNPSIVIHGAVYGHPTDVSLQCDVREVLEARIHANAGRILEISTDEKLTDLFGDPTYPHHTNKILQIHYEVRQLVGTLHADVTKEGRMAHALRIGWPSGRISFL